MIEDLRVHADSAVKAGAAWSDRRNDASTFRDRHLLGRSRVAAEAPSSSIRARVPCCSREFRSRLGFSRDVPRIRDFRLVACPWIRRSFGQTNYRAYVHDTETGEHVAWFFGTCLDSFSVAVPRHLWQLPLASRADGLRLSVRTPLRARDPTFNVTTRSRLGTRATGARGLRSGARAVGRRDEPRRPALVLLTHPMRGYFFKAGRRVGQLRDSARSRHADSG